MNYILKNSNAVGSVPSRWVLFCILCILAFTGCKKEAGTPMANAAYVRFYNGITYYPYPTTFGTPIDKYFPLSANKQSSEIFYGNVIAGGGIGTSPADNAAKRPAPMLSFFIDPVMDGQGLPTSTLTGADYLGVDTRYYPPQPDAVGDQERNIQPDFPGVLGLERAPTTGGVDLARWARVPAGKHRIVCVYRSLYKTGVSGITNTSSVDPTTRISFFNLNQAEKNEPLNLTTIPSIVALDTIIDLSSGEAYSLKIINTAMFNLQQYGTVLSASNHATVPQRYSLLVRNEPYGHQQYDKNKLYVRILNNTNDQRILPDEFDVYHRIGWFTRNDYYFDSITYTYRTKQLGGNNPTRFTAFEKVCTVSGRFVTDQAKSPFYPIDNIPVDSLKFPNGTFIPPVNIAANSAIIASGSGRCYSQHQLYFYKKGFGPAITGNPNTSSPGNYLGGYALALQPTAAFGSSGYQSLKVLNTIELSTCYATWNSFFLPRTTSAFFNSSVNFNITVIQEQMR